MCLLQKDLSANGLSQDTCEKVYSIMVTQLKTVDGLENIEVSDIQDPSLIKENQKSYKEAQFDAV